MCRFVWFGVRSSRSFLHRLSLSPRRDALCCFYCGAVFFRSLNKSDRSQNLNRRRDLWMTNFAAFYGSHCSVARSVDRSTEPITYVRIEQPHAVGATNQSFSTRKTLSIDEMHTNSTTSLTKNVPFGSVSGVRFLLAGAAVAHRERDTACGFLSIAVFGRAHIFLCDVFLYLYSPTQKSTFCMK